MPDDLEIRLLRYYLALAEELHFSRAAQRLFVAQQALSRDIRRLEDRLGVRLLDRTTRRVTLTPAGRKFQIKARKLVALHDATVREMRGERRSVTVDIVGAGLTPALVLATARTLAPDVEFFARTHNGPEQAVRLVLADQLDVTFGRHPAPIDDLHRQPVRYERISVLLPENHPLAASAAIPLPALRDAKVCVRAGDHVTPGWEHAVRQLLGPSCVDLAGSHPHVQGADELAHHLRQRDAPILTMTTQPAVPGAVSRPLTEPIALFPWTMMWRTDNDHPGIHALRNAADQLASRENWLSTPDDSWLPQPEARHRTVDTDVASGAQ
ncbi:LysR family transcriptional regulator [Fodinicola acaciae]|uniref:LysR family transcriptional regulator n=1 Tax=Fodinicola acaciae TaxID=2681555 RepID=UPI0013D80683|nr:LysR family transcriptional regulator [Fodinicola acaciae]